MKSRHKWDKSIKLAQQKNYSELSTLKNNYFQWLVDSGQEGKAGDYKIEERNYISAISLYLKGGFPLKAANVLIKYDLIQDQNQNQNQNQKELGERVANSLFKSGFYEKSGELFQKMSLFDKALDAFKKGNAFRAAVDLARIHYPQEVVKLEEQWGDYLVSIKQLDSSINHFIESGNSIKAIDAAIGAQQVSFIWKMCFINPL